jgi:hypothetical protein
MIPSKVDDAIVERVQQAELPKTLQVRVMGGSRLETVKPLAPLERTEKLRLRLAHAVKVKTIAYGLSAVVALAAGQAIRNVEREVTGYDPVKREQLLQRKAKKIESRNALAQQGDAQRYDIGTWLNVHYRSVTQAITNPKELIENSDSYQSLLEKYYNTLKVIDDASFIVPAFLLFIMLGGYIERKVNRSQDDVVGTEERERLRAKINEVIDVANRLNVRVDR